MLAASSLAVVVGSRLFLLESEGFCTSASDDCVAVLLISDICFFCAPCIERKVLSDGCLHSIGIAMGGSPGPPYRACGMDGQDFDFFSLKVEDIANSGAIKPQFSTMVIDVTCSCVVFITVVMRYSH